MSTPNTYIPELKDLLEDLVREDSGLYAAALILTEKTIVSTDSFEDLDEKRIKQIISMYHFSRKTLIELDRGEFEGISITGEKILALVSTVLNKALFISASDRYKIRLSHWGFFKTREIMNEIKEIIDDHDHFPNVIELPFIKEIEEFSRISTGRKFDSISPTDKLKLDSLEKAIGEIPFEGDGVAVLTREGIPLLLRPKMDLDEIKLGRLMAIVFSISIMFLNNLESEELHNFVIRGSRGYVVGMPTGEKILVIGITKEDIRLGLIFLDLSRICSKTTEILKNFDFSRNQFSELMENSLKNIL